MTRFFFYGTLCDPDILRMVLGYVPRPDQLVPASLAGYRRKVARGQSYPVLQPAAGGLVEGLLFQAASLADARRLDHYEGGEYLSLTLPVRPRNSPNPLLARVYLPRPGRLPAGSGDWQLETWQSQHKAAYIKRFMQ